MSTVCAFLIAPVVLTTFIWVTRYGVVNKRFTEILPLIVIQAISLFIWSCLACEQIGWFNEQISGHISIRGTDARRGAIECMLDYALLLEPVNMFLYTWRFLSTLERDEKHKTVKLIYRWFARITIFTVPIAFFSIYASYCIFYGKVIESYEQDNSS